MNKTTYTSSLPSEITLTAGAVAYQKRQKARWEELMLKADSIFARCNKSYESPLCD
jgi:hypothetical protein